MDELIFSGELLSSEPTSPFCPATITAIDGEGISLSINGGLDNLKKKYMRMDTGMQLSVGDRVLVAKCSGTYIVLGKIEF